MRGSPRLAGSTGVTAPASLDRRQRSCGKYGPHSPRTQQDEVSPPPPRLSRTSRPASPAGLCTKMGHSAYKLVRAIRSWRVASAHQISGLRVPMLQTQCCRGVLTTPVVRSVVRMILAPSPFQGCDRHAPARVVEIGEDNNEALTGRTWRSYVLYSGVGWRNRRAAT